MKKTNNILYIAATLLAAACSVKENPDDTLQPGGKTPLVLNATLSSGSAVTKATGKDFEENDVLLAYIRHLDNSNNPVNADKAPLLVAFKKGSAAMEATGNENIRKTADLTSVSPTDNTAVVPLYWDDFSNSANASTDLRTTGHGLQSFYGYCYNGGTSHISTALNAEAGTLGWTLPATYGNAAAVTNADLLWSPTQAKVTYDHSTAREGVEHGTLEIPYTHAMSQITVTLKAVDGFSGTPLTSTVLTLNQMNTVASLTAPTGSFTSSTPTAVTMYAGETSNSGLTREYTAIIAPGTKLKEGEKLLDITNADGNDYTLTITSTMLNSDAWGKNTDNYGNTVTVSSGSEGEPAKGYILTQPGVNYHLTVTINKTKVETRATLADWQTVNATGTGSIVYPDDEDDEHLYMDDSETPNRTNVNVLAVDKNYFANGASFSLFQLSATGHNEASSRTNDAYDFVTISTFDNPAGDESYADKWVNNPQIYWPNGSTNYYFRALAKFNNNDGNVNSIQSVGTVPSDKATTMQQGSDILWGTTAKHRGTSTGHTYEQGQAIPPRTGDVPISFIHAMSKVTFNLETASAATEAQVNLTGAKIAVTNLYTSGTINIDDGEISKTDGDKNTITDPLTSAAIPLQAAPISNLIVIPHETIGDDAKVIITLADGTTYSLQLNTCLSDNGTPENPNDDTAIVTWARGKHYTYTIHLEKEQITFRALVKDWEEKSGSGNANLEWD